MNEEDALLTLHVHSLKTYEAIKHDIKWKELKKLTDVAQNLKMLKDETERQHHKCANAHFHICLSNAG